MTLAGNHPPPDFECTLWWDVWLGVSINQCCVVHDLAGGTIASHFAVGRCAFVTLAAASPLHAILGVFVGTIMTVGLLTVGVVFRRMRAVHRHVTAERADNCQPAEKGKTENK